jgi:hypothetical protein
VEYFNRPDVKAAINAPPTTSTLCQLGNPSSIHAPLMCVQVDNTEHELERGPRIPESALPRPIFRAVCSSCHCR